MGLTFAVSLAIVAGAHKINTGHDFPDITKFISIQQRSMGARSLLEEDNGENNNNH